MLTNCLICDSVARLYLGEKIMSCFGCCSEDSMQKTADNGPYMTHHAAGCFQGLLYIPAKEPYLIVLSLHLTNSGDEKCLSI